MSLQEADVLAERIIDAFNDGDTDRVYKEIREIIYKKDTAMKLIDEYYMPFLTDVIVETERAADAQNIHAISFACGKLNTRATEMSRSFHDEDGLQ